MVQDYSRPKRGYPACCWRNCEAETEQDTNNDVKIRFINIKKQDIGVTFGIDGSKFAIPYRKKNIFTVNVVFWPILAKLPLLDLFKFWLIDKIKIMFANFRYSYDICEGTIVLNINHSLKYQLYSSFDDLKTWKL